MGLTKMSELQPPVTTAYSSLTTLPYGGIVQQSQSAAANATDVAASTSTAIAVPRGSGTMKTAAAASGGNVVAIQTTATEQATGSNVNVHEDPRAKLMYYLKCISSVFDEFNGVCREILNVESISQIENMLEYNKFSAITMKQCDQVLILCDALRLNLFINKCIFENAQKCGDSRNKFVRIEEVEKSVAVQNEIFVRGERRRVSKIMYYKPSYLEKNYYEPMRRLEHRLKVIRKGDHFVCTRVIQPTRLHNFQSHRLSKEIQMYWEGHAYRVI